MDLDERGVRKSRTGRNLQVARDDPGLAATSSRSPNTVLPAMPTQPAMIEFLTDHTVMADMHEVIQLAAILDDRIVRALPGRPWYWRRSRHRYRSAPADLRNLDPILTIRRKPETIRSNYCPGMG